MKYLALIAMPILFACNSNSTEHTADATSDSALYAPMIQPLTDSLSKFPGNADLHFRRALLLFNTDPGLAQKDFEKAAQLKPNVPDYWAGAGEAAILVENYKQAVTNFEKALHLAPKYAYLQYRLATALIENKQYKRADSLASKLANDPANHDKAYYLKAKIAEENKDTTLAIQHLKTAIDQAGLQSDYDAVMELGDLLAQRHAPASLQYYQLAARMDSTNDDATYAIGKFYEQESKLAAAITAFKNAINIDPEDGDNYFALGKIYFRQQEWQPAYNYFNMACKSGPTDGEAYYYRGRCNEKLGRKQQAIDDYSKAVTFKKDFTEAKEALANIQK
ncbi:tetratricopeptide repeat protein [Chitinophaga sp.]|uniref:tetratricopeptide repeat protein n=1 Tax=Chitinophaga sp. TaxID=1869181 RepID=UPI0031D609F6